MSSWCVRRTALSRCRSCRRCSARAAAARSATAISRCGGRSATCDDQPAPAALGGAEPGDQPAVAGVPAGAAGELDAGASAPASRRGSRRRRPGRAGSPGRGAARSRAPRPRRRAAGRPRGSRPGPASLMLSSVNVSWTRWASRSSVSCWSTIRSPISWARAAKRVSRASATSGRTVPLAGVDQRRGQLAIHRRPSSTTSPRCRRRPGSSTKVRRARRSSSASPMPMVSSRSPARSSGPTSSELGGVHPADRPVHARPRRRRRSGAGAADSGQRHDVGHGESRPASLSPRWSVADRRRRRDRRIVQIVSDSRRGRPATEHGGTD